MNSEKNRVELHFDDNDLKCLVGTEFGHDVYEKQIKGKIDCDKSFYFYFPKNIVSVTTSFVKGLFQDIISLIGLKETLERAHIESDNELLRQLIVSKIN